MRKQNATVTIIILFSVCIFSVLLVVLALSLNTFDYTAKVSSEDVSSEISSTVEVAAPVSSEMPEAEDARPENVGDKVCYLTFDDGPSLKVTPKILETLDKYNAKATFFVVGNMNDETFSLIEDINEQGHAIGIHSYTHDYAIYKSEEDYFSDIAKLDERIFGKIGIHTKLLRFPGGSSNISHKQYNEGIMPYLINGVVDKGYNYFDWNVGGRDADSTLITYVNGVRQPVPKDAIVRDVFDSVKYKSGDICVLMHDAGDKITTAEALPEIIEGLREMGYRFEALTPEVQKFKFKLPG